MKRTITPTINGEQHADEVEPRLLLVHCLRIETSGDIFASAEYRAHLTRVYTKRALAKAVGRAKQA